MLVQDKATHPAALDPRERQIIRQLARGHSDRQIASELHVSNETVRDSLERVYRKLGARTRVEAVYHAIAYLSIDRAIEHWRSGDAFGL